MRILDFFTKLVRYVPERNDEKIVVAKLAIIGPKKFRDIFRTLISHPEVFSCKSYCI